MVFTAIILSIILGSLILYCFSTIKENMILPPGPWGLPFIGKFAYLLLSNLNVCLAVNG